MSNTTNIHARDRRAVDYALHLRDDGWDGDTAVRYAERRFGPMAIEARKEVIG